MPNTGALGTPGATNSTPQGLMSPLSSATANLLSSPNTPNEVLGYLAGGYGAQGAQSALGAALGSASLGENPTYQATQAGELSANTGYSLANDLLTYQGLGLQSQGLASQAQTAAQEQGLERAEYAVQSGQYPEQMQEAALSNALAVQGNRDTGAISGTLGGQGYQRQQAAQGAEYGWQQADIYRAQQLAALGQQGEEVGYQGQQEQIANQMGQLGIAAKGAGVSTQQAVSQLGFGLNQLGYSSAPEQYLTQVANAQGSEAQNLSALGSQAALIGGLGPNFLNGVG